MVFALLFIFKYVSPSIVKLLHLLYLKEDANVDSLFETNKCVP